MDIHYLQAKIHGTQAGGGGGVRSLLIHYCPERLLFSGSGSKTNARRLAPWQWRGSQSAYFHTDKHRKLNSAALGHLEEIQIIKAAELTINTLVKHSHSQAIFFFFAWALSSLLWFLTLAQENNFWHLFHLHRGRHLRQVCFSTSGMLKQQLKNK